MARPSASPRPSASSASCQNCCRASARRPASSSVRPVTPSSPARHPCDPPRHPIRWDTGSRRRPSDTCSRRQADLAAAQRGDELLLVELGTPGDTGLLGPLEELGAGPLLGRGCPTRACRRRRRWRRRACGSSRSAEAATRRPCALVWLATVLPDVRAVPRNVRVASATGGERRGHLVVRRTGDGALEADDASRHGRQGHPRVGRAGR